MSAEGPQGLERLAVAELLDDGGCPVGPEEAIPHQRDPAVVPAEVPRIGAVVEAMVGRSVEEPAELEIGHETRVRLDRRAGEEPIRDRVDELKTQAEAGRMVGTADGGALTGHDVAQRALGEGVSHVCTREGLGTEAPDRDGPTGLDQRTAQRARVLVLTEVVAEPSADHGVVPAIDAMMRALTRARSAP